jgi:hypothetical protein
MSTSDFVLGQPPHSEGRRELWLQHVAGFILFEDVRNYAVARLDPGLDATARAAALKAIDDAVYGLMMTIDGVTGGLGNPEHLVHLETEVRLEARKGGAIEPIASLPLRDGDGMCMGFHMWCEGDFGRDPVLAPGRKRPKWWPLASG